MPPPSRPRALTGGCRCPIGSWGRRAHWGRGDAPEPARPVPPSPAGMLSASAGRRRVIVGFFDRFRRPKPAPAVPALLTPPAAPAAPLTASAPAVSLAGAPGFAVIDAETTGLSPNSHRILELAIVRTDPIGRVVDEWVCRFHPGGPVGATHIHGI